jgi:hypothetical protein
VRHPAGVDRGTRGTDRRAERVGEALDGLEVATGATIAASVSSGRPEALRGCWATICAFLAESEIVAANSSTVPAAPTSSTGAELGFTVMSGTPLVTLPLTV